MNFCRIRGCRSIHGLNVSMDGGGFWIFESCECRAVLIVAPWTDLTLLCLNFRHCFHENKIKAAKSEVWCWDQGCARGRKSTRDTGYLGFTSVRDLACTLKTVSFFGKHLSFDFFDKKKFVEKWLSSIVCWHPKINLKSKIAFLDRGF